MLPDEQGIDFIRDVGRVPMTVGIEGKETDANDQEERELNKDHDPACQQRRPALALIAGGEKALDQQLFGAVAGGGQKGSADDSGPKAVGSCEEVRPSEIEYLKLSERRGKGDHVRPSAMNLAEDHPEAE